MVLVIPDHGEGEGDLEHGEYQGIFHAVATRSGHSEKENKLQVFRKLGIASQIFVLELDLQQ